MQSDTGMVTAAGTSTSAGESRVILLVEDEEVVREVTARVLESGGYRVLQARGPKDALHVTSTHPGNIDLVLTDVVMPEMNGVELVEQILALRPELVTVFMSGYAQTDTFRKAAGRAATHIQKPFTVKSLLSRIAQALESKLGEEVFPRGIDSTAKLS